VNWIDESLGTGLELRVKSRGMTVLVGQDTDVKVS